MPQNIRLMNKNDIERLLSIHLQAFKGYMNASLGNDYVRAFLGWFQDSPCGLALVAEENNQTIGYVVGAQLGYGKELNNFLLKIGIWSILTNPRIFFHPQFIGTIINRLKLLLQKSENETKNYAKLSGKGISLVGIGVDPLFTGKGAGVSLLKAFEEKAKLLGYTFMRLSVYRKNERARNLYSKNGWKVLETDGPVLYYYKEI
ncbi:MAG: GNAT family N-acetyltransferase [Bacteroidota bacterium]|jgi:ribosomal protein S18 acetylase RimI-like enzyme